MKLIPFAAAVAFASTAGLVAIPAQAQTSPKILVIKTAPPAPLSERVPAARRGHAWVPGYWDWNGNRYTWVSGHFERVRQGYVYARPEWKREGNGWVLERGGWRAGARDRDLDGVQNRADARPGNPNRY